jgi:RND family efflux transporter MFP subunit
VEIRLQDEPTYRWKGRMEFVDNALDASSGTIRGRALVSNPDNFLTPGMFGHLRLLGSGSYSALLIPDQAVVTDQERQVVDVVGKDNIAHAVAVELGPLSRGLRVIRSGLAAGDLIVIDGVQRVQSGSKVDPRRGRIVAQAPDASQAVLNTAPQSSSAEPAGGGR